MFKKIMKEILKSAVKKYSSSDYKHHKHHKYSSSDHKHHKYSSSDYKKHHGHHGSHGHHHYKKKLKSFFSS